MHKSQAFVVLVIYIFSSYGSAQLTSDFYKTSCPNALSIVESVVKKAVQKEARMAASLLRLHFHDCFVNGCDGSILLDDTSSFTGEQTAFPNLNSVRGFEVVDQIKTALETECSGVVSCADILAIAARDSVVLKGGSSWTVLLGRRDSTTASKTAANKALPAPTDTLATIVSKYQAVGLSVQDVVASSGAHTIGRSRCSQFSSRLYNFSGTGKPDSTLQNSYLKTLKQVCPQSGDGNTLAPLDPVTKDQFDNNYFKNLLNNKGLLQSDQELYSTPGASTVSFVNSYATSQAAFFSDFAAFMLRMGNIAPLTGNAGQIRKSCGVINS